MAKTLLLVRDADLSSEELSFVTSVIGAVGVEWEDLPVKGDEGQACVAFACNGKDTLIVACGNAAAGLVLDRDVKITKEVGHIHSLGESEVILQFCPSYVIKLAQKKGGLSEKTKRLWFDVWDQIHETLRGTRMEKPEVYPLSRPEAVDLLEWFVNEYEGPWAYDYETWGDVSALRPELCRHFKVVSCGMAIVKDDQIWAFSWLVDRNPDKYNDRLEELWRKAIEKKNAVAHFARYEHKVNRKRYGVQPPLRDTMLMMRAIDEIADGSLERVMLRCGITWANYKSEYDSVRKNPTEADEQSLLVYNALDAYGTLASSIPLEKELAKEKLTRIARQDEGISARLARLESTGMYADAAAGQEVRVQIDKEETQSLKDLRCLPAVQNVEAWALSGGIKKFLAGKFQRGEVEAIFNPSSPPMMRRLCIDELGIPVEADVKSGKVKLDKKSLEKWVKAFPLLQRLNEYRSAKSMVGFLDQWDEFVGPSGCVHTQYNQHIVVTGRLSSTDPPLQNIPKKSVIRRLFGSRFRKKGRGWVVSADFAQQEPRLIAGWSGDAKMIEVILEGMSLHAFVAAEIFGCDYDWVVGNKDSKEYDIGKKMNLGIAYGQTEYGLAQKTGISEDEARALLRKYDRLFPGVEIWRMAFHKFATIHGYVCDLFGARRHLPDAQSSDKWVRERALRQAGNFPVQGSAYRFTQISLGKAIDYYDQNLDGRGLITGQVHDSITAECDEDSRDEAVHWLREAMLCHNTASYWAKYGMPMAVDIKVGRNLYELEEVK